MRRAAGCTRMRDFERHARIADFVRDQLALIMQRRLRDPRLRSVNVNEVRIGRDLSIADVYVTSLDALEPAGRAELVEVLNLASGFFRSELARRLSMRKIPKPRFHYDASVEQGPRLERLIAEAVASDRGARGRG